MRILLKLQVEHVSATMFIPTRNFSFYCPDESMRNSISDEIMPLWLGNKIPLDMDGALMIEKIVERYS